ncbi:hypothetical protein N7499_012604 [Penicillium canescens]|uniref:Apple domain-containing protein n=1 Tax=Penicillium canescens TaxID=5083 RepID=A0AAD6I3M9_PENCN|nr:uncharacterized protein N7446_000750 [Penicillium canescens]KAJ6012791.1 hypothetical protein N7522_003146 [Penicillium canescens]KAJ6030188.1 hypothetical protein N7460_010454 [Penicillium canescens]KAJ6060565.1 hypothetical protein N7444_002419 [Penicillium canescens]KAJ6063924.1 hypothetical protein N7499_012604 [Penicillium canescens]KAJ6077814.1 hypothetical protein N7446_000750 [Penicillium canescens]
MVKIFNLLFLCGALLVVKITPSYAQGLIVQRSGVAGARFGQGSGSRSGLGRGCCCYEEPEPPTVPERKICENDTQLDEQQTITSGGRTYRIWCNAIKHGENDLGYDIAVKSIDECIELCNKKATCVRAITTKDETICYLRSHGNNLIPDSSGYISAHLE